MLSVVTDGEASQFPSLGTGEASTLDRAARERAAVAIDERAARRMIGLAEKPTRHHWRPPGMLKVALIASAVSVVVADCGSTVPPYVGPHDCQEVLVDTGSDDIPAPTPLTISPATGAESVTVTDRNGGSLVVLRIRQRMIVQLRRPLSWREPVEVNQGILRKDQGGTCADGTASAGFTAVGEGGTEVYSFTDAPCLHATPACSIPVRRAAFRISVHR